MKRIASTMALTVVPVALLAAAGTSVADERGNPNLRLRGEYAFTQSQTCFTTNSNFDGETGLIIPPPIPPTPPIPPAYANPNRTHSTLSGILHFNGDGTGTSTFRVQTILASIPPPIPFTEAEGSCTLTYSVDPDGGGTIHFTLCSSTTTAAGGLGGGGVLPMTSVNTGNQMSFQLVQGDRMGLIGPSAQPVVDRLDNTFNGITTTTYRTCAKSGVLRKLDHR